MSDDTATRLRALAEDLLAHAVGESWVRLHMQHGSDVMPIHLVVLRHLVHAAVERGYGLGLLRAAEVDAQEAADMADTSK